MLSKPKQKVTSFTNLLGATAVGVYLLIIAGTTTAVTDAVLACSTWPACNAPLNELLSQTELLIVIAHRTTALLVGLLLITTVWRGIQETSDMKIRLALGVSLGLYPLQIGIGALTAISEAPVTFSSAHLITAMLIFSSLLLALVWRLENTHEIGVETGDKRERVERKKPQKDVERSTQLRRTVEVYLELTKPKLMWLLCLVALAAMGMAAGRGLDLNIAVATLAGGCLAIGASGTFNHILERDVDKEMNRTNERPLVEGRIPLRNAAVFGVLLTLASIGVFVVFVNVLAATLGLLAILFYSVVYTMILKPHTTQNIVLGGAVGAFPALIGWAAVTKTVEIPAVVLGAVIFLWTPAHFYNLALVYKDDYESAGFPMLPVIRGDKVTLRHILLYFGATMLSVAILGFVTNLGWVYGIISVVLAMFFIQAVISLYQKQTREAALRTFVTSNIYLGSLLLAIVIDTIFV